MCRWHRVGVCRLGHSDESGAPAQCDGLCALSAEVQELRSALRRLAAHVMWHSGTEVQTEEKNSQEQYEESMIESPESRTDEVIANTVLNESKATLESSITDTESEYQSAQFSATEENYVPVQYEEFMTESLISRADKVKESTASSDFKGTLMSSITDTESELQPEKHHVDLPAPLKLEQNVKEVNGSIERVQQRTEELNVNVPWEVIQLITQARISDGIAEQIDDLPAPLEEYEESMTESSQSRADKLIENTALNDFKSDPRVKHH